MAELGFVFIVYDPWYGARAAGAGSNRVSRVDLCVAHGTESET
ncbi:MAG TPA: hypothetical protein VFJ58_17530 [Armatimonadota bacterium]|nr:hypothetical protein [Armatimonadota bacterium]